MVYRWDGTEIRTVGELAHVGELQGLPIGREVRATPDGSALAFVTQAALDPADDDGAEDVYVWTEDDGLARASGDGALPATFFALPDPTAGRFKDFNFGRVLSGDGSRVFFNSNDALTADAHDDGFSKTYEWERGKGIDLVAAPPGEHASYVDNSADGSTVFFQTSASLLSSDIDAGERDLYAARIGGGFPQPPAPTRCFDDACQGAYSPPPPLLGSGTANVSARPAPVVPRFSLRALTRAQRARLARGRRVELLVRVNRSGAVGAVVRARSGRRTFVVQRTSRRAARAGTVRIGLRLSRAARKALAARERLRLTVSVRFAGAGRSRSLTVDLRKQNR